MLVVVVESQSYNILEMDEVDWGEILVIDSLLKSNCTESNIHLNEQLTSLYGH